MPPARLALRTRAQLALSPAKPASLPRAECRAPAPAASQSLDRWAVWPRSPVPAEAAQSRSSAPAWAAARPCAELAGVGVPARPESAFALAQAESKRVSPAKSVAKLPPGAEPQREAEPAAATRQLRPLLPCGAESRASRRRASRPATSQSLASVHCRTSDVARQSRPGRPAANRRAHARLHRLRANLNGSSFRLRQRRSESPGFPGS